MCAVLFRSFLISHLSSCHRIYEWKKGSKTMLALESPAFHWVTLGMLLSPPFGNGEAGGHFSGCVRINWEQVSRGWLSPFPIHFFDPPPGLPCPLYLPLWLPASLLQNTIFVTSLFCSKNLSESSNFACRSNHRVYKDLAVSVHNGERL